METIIEAFVQAWWWFQAATDEHLIVLLTLVGSSAIASWLVQHWKRRYSIDLMKQGKLIIISVLSLLSGLFSIVDWYMLGNLAEFVPWFAGYGSAIYMVATILHRIHVSPLYAKIQRLLRYVADQTDQARQAKYVPATTPPETTRMDFK